MNTKHIGFLHPGEMGLFLAAAAQNAGHIAYWASQGRSEKTIGRAQEQNLVERLSVKELCEQCSVIVSVCPPHVAMAVAEKVVACSFNGLYADVNAISPQQAKRIGQVMKDAGVEFVDGGIIGVPAKEPGRTWLYLSGPAAGTVAECFAGGSLAVEVIGREIGKASALKMCFAANTKGTTALLCAVVAAAEKMGVRTELERHWSRDGSAFVKNTHAGIAGVTAKAWRFSGEMEEIASTFEEAGLPGGFHLAAAELYRRIATFKNADPLPALEDALEALVAFDQHRRSAG